MISKTFLIARMIVLASLALSSAAWAATCSNASEWHLRVSARRHRQQRYPSSAATITPKGHSEMHFSFVVVDDGKEMLAIETDADTVVSGTLQR